MVLILLGLFHAIKCQNGMACPKYCLYNGGTKNIKLARKEGFTCLKRKGDEWECQRPNGASICYINWDQLDITRNCLDDKIFKCPEYCSTKNRDTFFISEAIAKGYTIWRRSDPINDGPYSCGKARIPGQRFKKKDYIDIRKHCKYGWKDYIGINEKIFLKEIDFPDAGELVFSDEFKSKGALNTDRWEYTFDFNGGDIDGFQYYDAGDDIAYLDGENLVISPKRTFIDENEYKISFIKQLHKNCTQKIRMCSTMNKSPNYIKPVRSVKIQPKDFYFRYGKMEVRAKLPAGNWLWPLIQLLPTKNYYGTWPKSGSMDFLSSKGNDEYYKFGGFDHIFAGLHWGPPKQDMWPLTSNKVKPYPLNTKSLVEEFHVYKMEWYYTGIRFSVDGKTIYSLAAPPDYNTALDKIGGFTIINSSYINAKTDIAPFDQDFSFSIQLMMGGINGNFPDEWGKPWNNSWSMKDSEYKFVEDQTFWHWTWERPGLKDFKIDYVRVWTWKNDFLLIENKTKRVLAYSLLYLMIISQRLKLRSLKL